MWHFTHGNKSCFLFYFIKANNLSLRLCPPTIHSLTNTSQPSHLYLILPIISSCYGFSLLPPNDATTFNPHLPITTLSSPLHGTSVMNVIWIRPKVQKASPLSLNTGHTAGPSGWGWWPRAAQCGTVWVRRTQPDTEFHGITGHIFQQEDFKCKGGNVSI